MPINLSEFRQQYPQYNDMPDQELAEGLHRKFYNDMPFDEFAGRVGLAQTPVAVTTEAPGESFAMAGKQLGLGIVHGTIGVAESLGTGLEYAGKRMETTTEIPSFQTPVQTGEVMRRTRELANTMPLAEAKKQAEAETLEKNAAARKPIGEFLSDQGKTVSGYWGKAAEPFGPEKRFEGKNLWDNPEMMKSPAWWAYNVGEMLPSLAASIVPAVGAAKAIQVGGTVAKWAPETIASVAKFGAAVTGGAVGGALEGTQTYKEVLKNGGTEPEAATAAELMTMFSAGLNAVSTGKMLGEAAPGFMARVKKFALDGVVEGLSEGAEEPAEVMAKIGGKLATGQDVPENIGQMFIESLKDAVTVAPVAALTGGVGGAMAGPARKPKKASTETQDLLKKSVEGATAPGLPGEPDATAAAPPPPPPTGPLRTPGARQEFIDQTLPNEPDRMTAADRQAVIDRQFPTEDLGDGRTIRIPGTFGEDADVLDAGGAGAMAGPMAGPQEPTDFTGTGEDFGIGGRTALKTSQDLLARERARSGNRGVGVVTEGSLPIVQQPQAPFRTPEERQAAIRWDMAPGSPEEVEAGRMAAEEQRVIQPAMRGATRGDIGLGQDVNRAVMDERQRQGRVGMAERTGLSPVVEASRPWMNRTEADRAQPYLSGEVAAGIDAAAHEAATSPMNDLPEPTEGQKDAGNYRKGHIRFDGLEISVENPDGSERSGVDKAGKKWSSTMRGHYGYFRRTEGKDGDQVDVFVAPGAAETGKAFVIDQVDPGTGKFDEHKAILGVATEAEARELYQANYEEGWTGLGAITEMDMGRFKEWLRDDSHKRPVGALPQADAATAPRIDDQGAMEGPAPPASSPAPSPPTPSTIATTIGGVHYDGEYGGMPGGQEPAHSFTATEGPAKGGSFTVRGDVTEEKVRAALAEIEGQRGEKDLATEGMAGVSSGVTEKTGKGDITTGQTPTPEGGNPFVVYHAKTKGDFRGDRPSVDIGSDADIMGKGFYFSTDKDYASRYGTPEEYRIMGKFADTKQWTAALERFADRPIQKQRELARKALKAEGYSGVIQGDVGVAWDQGVFEGGRPADEAGQIAATPPQAPTAPPETKRTKALREYTDYVFTLSAADRAAAGDLIVDSPQSPLGQKLKIQKRVVEARKGKPAEATAPQAAPTPPFVKKEAWQITADDYDTMFPLAGDTVDGRRVLLSATGQGIPNMDSIESSLENPTEVSGIREVPISAFEDTDQPAFASKSEELKTKALAEAIKRNAEIAPLIVVYDSKGPYILEGAHRFDALKMIGAKSFPAKVVFDEDSLYDAAKEAVEAGKPVPAEVLKDYPDLQRMAGKKVPQKVPKTLTSPAEQPTITPQAEPNTKPAAEMTADELLAEWDRQAGQETEADRAKREAAQHIDNAVQALKDINAILGEKGSFSTENEVDPDKWAKIRPLLKRAWDEMVAAGKSGAEFVKLSIQTLSPKGRPYFEKFVKEEVSPEKPGGKKEAPNESVRGQAPAEPQGEQAEAVPGTEEGPGRGSEVLPDEGRGSPAAKGRPDRVRNAGVRSGGGRGEGASRVEAGDYQITEKDRLGQGGPKQKYRDNVAAIRLLSEIGDRKATAEEQAVLAKYVGWGGLPQAFPRPNGSVASGWEKEVDELKSLLPKGQYEPARASTQDAHYTSEPIIRGVYNALKRFGFKGGKILEPSVGTGNFIGLMPPTMRGQSKITGVELDPTTAKIAKLLYPGQNILQSGFQDFTIAPNSYDLAIGNPPFGDKKLFDARHKDLSSFSIHNYFFAKSLIGLRPNGILAMVVSSHMMDKQDSTQREWFDERAEFLGAIRLPNNAFRGNAGTDVTTDIVFLRKIEKGESISRPAWTDLRKTDGKDGVTYRINEYFVNHPEMMLGDLGPNKLFPGEVKNGVYDAVPGMLPREGVDTSEAIAKAITALPENIYTPAKKTMEEVQNPEILVPDAEFVQPYGYGLDDKGRAVRRFPDINGEQVFAPVMFSDKPLEGMRLERFKGMLGIRDAVRRLIRAEIADDPNMSLYRSRLNEAYDGFVKEYGYISTDANSSIMKDDPTDFPLLRSLEVGFDKGVSKLTGKKTGEKYRPATAKKASIFTVRMREPYRSATSAKNAKDALAIVLREDGRVDMDRVAELYGATAESAAQDLAGVVFIDPATEAWETKDAYLSGNVKKKLALAQRAASEDPVYLKNVEALEKVLPEDVPPEKIKFRIGATWIPADLYEGFASEVVQQRVRISYSEKVGVWAIKAERSGSASPYDSPGMGAEDIMKAMLQSRDIAVYEKDADGKRHLNQEFTLVAKQKADEMDQAFQDWVLENADRRERVAKIFNDKVNTTIEGENDGSHMIFPGMGVINAAVKRDDQLRRHQKNVVWRLIQRGKGLLDHVVGSGKTFASVAAGMEMKRMGLVKKPMYVVPNHLVPQWSEDFQKLYPGSNVLVIGKKDFAKANRQEFLGRIATGDWDAVLMAHSSFGFIRMPTEYQMRFFADQVAQYEEAITALTEEEGGKSKSVKDMEKAKAKLEEKMKALADRPKDAVVDFSELGVDALFVDEAHEFKNLFYVTKRQRVAGLGNQVGSQKAFDLFVKTRYLQDTNGGKGVFFMTGTPVSNSIAEMYTMMRYLAYDRLQDMGIKHFDQWSNMFASAISDWEVDPSGTRYRLQAKLDFVNLPGLMSFYRDFADVVSTEDLRAWAKERGEIWPIPDVKGGKPENVVAERSDLQANFMDWIVNRMDNMPGDPREDNPLKATGEAMKGALDIRLIRPDLPDFEGSKVNIAVKNILKTHKKWEEKKGTQLVFCDLSVPKKAGAKLRKEISDLRAQIKVQEDLLETDLSDERRMEVEQEYTGLVDELGKYSYGELIAAESAFSVYDDVKSKLIAGGIPEAEIAFIHDANTELQKEELFGKVRSGRVRVLIGSTSKMGAGMNVQNKLVALHHLDAPWRPSDLEQREGRIIRQGNEFFEEMLKKEGKIFEVGIFRYATKETLDSRRWQVIERKALNIEKLRAGEHEWGETIEDATGEATNAAEMKAAASGNPMILQEIKLRQELKKLEALKSGHRSQRFAMERKLKEAKEFVGQFDQMVEGAKADQELVAKNPKDHSPQGWNVTLDGVTYKAEGLVAEGEKGAEKANAEALKAVKERFAEAVDGLADRLLVSSRGTAAIVYRGVTFDVEKDGWSRVNIVPDLYGSGWYGLISYPASEIARDGISSEGLIVRLDNLLNRVLDKKEVLEKNLNDNLSASQRTIATAEKELGKTFDQDARMDEIRTEHAAVLKALQDEKANAPQVERNFSMWTGSGPGPRAGAVPATERDIEVLNQQVGAKPGAYYANMGEAGFQEVKNAKRADIVPWAETFIHKNQDTGQWHITEATTGLQVYAGTGTKENAIRQASERLTRVGDAEFNRVVQSGIEQSGRSPYNPLTNEAGFVSFSLRDLLTGPLPDNWTERTTDDLSRRARAIQPPHWIAKKFPEFKKLYERQQNRVKDRLSALADAMEQTADFWEMDKGKDLDQLKGLVWAMEDRKIEDITDKRFQEDKETGDYSLNEGYYLELRKWLDRKIPGLTDAVKDAYVNIRRSLDKDLATVFNTMRGLEDIDESVITSFRKSMGQIHNYFPHMRYGGYYVQVAGEKGDVVYREHFDAPGGVYLKLRAKVKEIEAQFPGMSVNFGKVEKIPEEVFGIPIPIEALEAVMDAAIKRIEDPEAQQAFKNALPKAISDALKSRGWGSHMIKRKNIPGYETEDIKRVLFDYKAGLYGWITKMQAARDFSRIMAKTDARKQPVLWGAMRQYAYDMMANADQVDKWVNTARAVFFAKYLGLNFKTAALNMTQNLISGVPRLGMETGGAGGKWLKGSMDDVVGMVTERKNLPAEEKKLLEELYDEGLTKAAFLDEVRGQISQNVFSVWNKTLKVLGWPMQMAERFNRVSLALAAFRVARGGAIKNEKTLAELGLKPGQKADFETAKRFAENIVEDAHFVYGKSNRPEMFRGSATAKVFSTAYTFRTFTHNMVNLWTYMWKNGGPGKRAVMKSIAATMVLGGITSIPIYKTFMHLVRQLTGDDWEEEYVLKQIPDDWDLMRDMVLYGVPAVTGFTIGGSLGMELPVFDRLRIGQGGKEQIWGKTGEILGIPGAVIDDVITSLGAVQSGQYGRAIEALAPSVVANVQRAVRLYETGQTTASGKPINLPGKAGPRKLTGAEAIGKAAGFQPVSSQKSWDIYSGLEDAKDYKGRKQSEFADRIANAQRKGDQPAMDSAKADWVAWNQEQMRRKRFEFIITQADLTRSLQSRAKTNQPPEMFRGRAAESMRERF